jgi:hypothetical protein
MIVTLHATEHRNCDAPMCSPPAHNPGSRCCLNVLHLKALTSSRCDVALFSHLTSSMLQVYRRFPTVSCLSKLSKPFNMSPYLTSCWMFVNIFFTQAQRNDLVILFLFLFIVHPPPRLSSLFFNWATTIIHCIFICDAQTGTLTRQLPTSNSVFFTEI